MFFYAFYDFVFCYALSLNLNPKYVIFQISYNTKKLRQKWNKHPWVELDWKSFFFFHVGDRAKRKEERGVTAISLSAAMPQNRLGDLYQTGWLWAGGRPQRGSCIKGGISGWQGLWQGPSVCRKAQAQKQVTPTKLRARGRVSLSFSCLYISNSYIWHSVSYDIIEG